jgi:hypothetical protein
MKEDELAFGIEERNKTDAEIFEEAINKKEVTSEELEELFVEY